MVLPISKSKELKKVIFAGLDAGGKTSILLLLNRKFSLLSSIKPTFKAKISSQSLSFLGLDVSNWDLGGQRNYREMYLADPHKYFSDLQSLFFVIDVQAPQRYEEVLDYLEDIINVVSKMKIEDPTFQFVILFHKLDPDIENNLDINEGINELKKSINSLTDDVNFSFYKTSIYDESSLIKAFSDGVISVSHKAKLIQTLLKEYMSQSFNSAAVLLDQQGFIIASRSTDPSYLQICEAIAPRLSYALEKLENWDINTIDIVTNIEFPKNGSDKQKEGLIFLRKLNIFDTRLYLIALCLNRSVKARSYEYLPMLAKNLKNLLESYE